MKVPTEATKSIGVPLSNRGYAPLRITTVKTYGFKNDLKEKSVRMEQQVPVESLVTNDCEVVSVTASVSTKLSDAVHYDPYGTWDKIPFSVEVFSSVTLQCDQDAEKIRAAHEMAYDLAWGASRKHIYKAVAGHTVDIKKRLCAEYFPEEEE